MPISGKEALLKRGLTRALDALFAVLEEPDVAGGRAVERVRVIVSRVADVTLDLLPELSFLFRVRGASKIERDALERRREFDRYVTALIGQAQRDGDLRADIDARLLARLVFGMSISVVEWYRSGSTIDRSRVASSVAALAFDGMTQRS